MGMSRIIRLHVYSGQFALLLPHESEEVYRVDQIKEFEHISQAYKDWLAEILEKGIRITFDGTRSMFNLVLIKVTTYYSFCLTFILNL